MLKTVSTAHPCISKFRDHRLPFHCPSVPLGSGYLTDRNGTGARLTVTTLVQTVGMSLLLVWRFCRGESTHSALSTVAAT